MARKMLSSDFKNLKAKVKAEALRRCKSGSVAEYGGAAYDYTEAPADGGAVKGEHLEKILEPMQAINPDGLPEYPGELTEDGIETMETKAAAWAARSMTNRGTSDCKSGCTGTCTTGCSTGCYGCSGCGGSCSSSCKEGDCYGQCSGCSGCGSGCANSCTGQCSGCSGCGSGCASSCTGGCKGCSGTCSGTCSGSCLYGCSTGCYSTGSNLAK